MTTTPDYIIVGGGSAGCVLANRLSADPACEVLLLEAGNANGHPLMNVPGAYAKLFRTPIDWALYSEPQPHLHNRRLFLPRGKTLGGSSSTNAMAYVRGNAADYDDWAALGNAGWSYREVLPYFIRSEHNEQFADLDQGFHGRGGPLNVTFAQRFRTPFAEAFVEACTEWGLPRNADYNGREQRGAGFFQFTIKGQRRHSAADAFLQPVLGRPNLRVITRARAQEILLEGDRATGIRFRTPRGEEIVSVKREVILAAGSFHSPHLLMHSGIGDAEELRYHGIEPKHHLPGVGKNLQDHLFFPVSAISKQRAGQNHNLTAWAQASGLARFLLFKAGPLTISPLEAVAFLNPDDPNGRVKTQLHFVPIHVGGGYNYDMYDLRTYPTRPDGFTILPSLLHPRSRGTVSLAAKDPAAPARIQPNFLADEADLETLLKGARAALDIMRQSAFEPYRDRLVMPPDISSDDAVAEHIRRSVETIYHPVGTCKMGTDELAVVDPQLRVHGLGGLRVVDASIMPTIVTGNTNAPVMMIAEKAADLILQRPGERGDFSEKSAARNPRT